MADDDDPGSTHLKNFMTESHAGASYTDPGHTGASTRDMANRFGVKGHTSTGIPIIPNSGDIKKPFTTKQLR